MDAVKYMESRLADDEDLQDKYLEESVKRFLLAQNLGNTDMAEVYHVRMHRIAKKHGLMRFLGHLLNG